MTRTSLTGKTLLAAVSAITFGLLAGEAAAQTLHSANYLGGGVWEQDANWSTTVYPNNGRTRPDANGNPIPGPNPIYNANLDHPTPCTLAIGVRIQTLNVLAGSTLNLSGSVWANTGFGNAGLITLNSTGNFTGMLRAGANSNVVDGGEIFMSDSFSNSVTAGAGGKILTISAGGRIRGAGNVNAYHGDDVRAYFQIVNHGLIEAMQPNNAMRINLTDDAAFTDAMVNDGTLRASSSGVLYILAPFGSNENVLNEGGTIEAIDNGTVRLQGKATITGGTLATSGNGTIRGDVPGSSGGTFKDLTNTGTMVIAQDETFGLAGTFTNNGLVRIDATTTSGSGLLMRGATVALNGTGLIAMDGGAGIAGGDAVGQTAVVGSGLTIRGKGIIGTNNSNFLYKALNLVNRGLIDATGPLTIFTGTDTTVTNDGGTLRASDGGQLHFSNAGAGVVLNTGGTVKALADSVVRVNNLVTLEGGTVTTSGSGTIRGGVNSGGTLKNVTSTGSVAIGAAETLGLAGTFVNNGSVTIDGSAQLNNTVLVVRDDVTLAGSGLVTMSGGYYGAVIANEAFSGKTLTVSPGVTIRGDGHFQTKLVNQGTIDATNYMLFALNNYFVRDTFNNGGILRARSGSYIEVNGNGPVTFSNEGLMEALSNSTIKFTGGAKLTNYAGGTIQLEDGTFDVAAGVDLDGGELVGRGTFTGPVRNNGGTVAPGLSAGKIIVNGNYTQSADGVLEIEIGGKLPGEKHDQLQVNGTATIGGTLRLRLSGQFTPSSSDVFTIVASQAAIQGAFANVANGARLKTADGFGSFKVTYNVVDNAALSQNVTLSDFRLALNKYDFNLDGNADYLLYNPSTRRAAIWLLDQTKKASSAFVDRLIPRGYKIVDSADFNADRMPDLLLFNATTGETKIWFLTGKTRTGVATGPTIGNGYTLIGAADFDRDGDPDYLLYNPSTRRTAIRFLNGTTFVRSALGPVITVGFMPVAAGDFNSDGFPDLALFKAANGQTAIWHLNGASKTFEKPGPTIPEGYVLKGVATFPGDLKSDFVLVNPSTRQTRIWYLDGTNVAEKVKGPTLAPGFALVAP